MSEEASSRAGTGGRTGSERDPTVEEAHPRGTLLIVALYGLIFALGWLALYFLVFLPRGTVTP